MVSLGLDRELGTLHATMQVGGDGAERMLRCRVELGSACLGAILGVVEARDGDAVFAVDLGGSIGLDQLFAGLACHLHYSTFEVFLVVGFDRVSPIIALVAINFPDNLNDQVRVMMVDWRRRRCVVIRCRNMFRRRRGLVVVRRWRRLLWWWWRGVVVRWWG